MTTPTRPGTAPANPRRGARSTLPREVAATLVGSGATTRPPEHSSPRAHRLLTAATEAGLGALALSCLERVNIAELDLHDRVTLLRVIHDHTAWLEALHTEAIMGVAGPLDGWVTDEVEEIIYESTTGSPLVRRDRADVPPISEVFCGQTAQDAPPTSLVLLDDVEPGTRSVPSAWEFAECESDAWNTREMAATVEVALATTVSKRTAGRRIDSSRFLHAHPIALAMARIGRWSFGHLRVCESELAGLDADLIDTVLADVSAIEHREAPNRLALRIRKSLARHDGPAMTERIRANREVVEADGWMLPDGQGRIMLTANHTRISQALDALNDLADARRAWLRAAGAPIPDADTLRGQLLLAAIATATWSSTDEVLREGIPATPPHIAPTTPSTTSSRESARARRRRQQAAIIVDLPTALAMNDEPGFIPGYGWVPAQIARELAAASDDWSRWLIDDESRTLLDTNNTKYRPSEALRRFIATRAQDCTMPVCSRPASDAQLDHADDFDGANTTTANLHPACGPDHLIVTAGYFLVTLDEHGRATWTSTTSGHSYDNPAHPLFEAGPKREAVEAFISPIEAASHRLLRDAA